MKLSTTAYALMLGLVTFNAQSSQLPDELPMASIQKPDDATQFANRMVAFTARTAYLMRTGFLSSQLKFAYVSEQQVDWDNGQLGHQLIRIVNQHDRYDQCALTKSQLVNAELFMRRATEEEIAQLKCEINAGTQKFEDGFKVDAKELALARLNNK